MTPATGIGKGGEAGHHAGTDEDTLLRELREAIERAGPSSCFLGASGGSTAHVA